MVSLQKQYETRLAQIEDEARDKIQAAVREAQAAREALLAKAHADAQGIVERAQQELERERQIAMAEMRDQIARLSTAAASRIIRQTLDPAAHAGLIDEVIGSLGTAGSRN